MKLRVGVVGTGVMGKNHVRAYAGLPDHCQLVGVYDADSRNAVEIAAQYDMIAYPTLEDLLGHVDAVSVAVPTPAHYSVGMVCVGRHVHLLMEKPLTESEGQAKRLIRAARRADVLLQTGHIELFNPVVRALTTLMKGEMIISAEFRRLRPLEPRLAQVDVVHDAMIHDIYLLLHLLDDRIAHLDAAGWHVDGVNRHAAALVQMRGGAVVQLTASFLSAKKQRLIQLTTCRERIMADLLNGNIQKMSLQEAGAIQSVPVPIHDALTEELAHFLTRIRAGRRPIADGEQGLAALSVANRIRNRIRYHYDKYGGKGGR